MKNTNLRLYFSVNKEHAHRKSHHTHTQSERNSITKLHFHNIHVIIWIEHPASKKEHLKTCLRNHIVASIETCRTITGQSEAEEATSRRKYLLISRNSISKCNNNSSSSSSSVTIILTNTIKKKITTTNHLIMTRQKFSSVGCLGKLPKNPFNSTLNNSDPSHPWTLCAIG